MEPNEALAYETHRALGRLSQLPVDEAAVVVGNLVGLLVLNAHRAGGSEKVLQTQQRVQAISQSFVDTNHTMGVLQ